MNGQNGAVIDGCGARSSSVAKERWTRQKGVSKAAILAAVVAPLWLGAVVRAEDPAGCSFAAAGASIQNVPSGSSNHGDQICYNVCYDVADGNINSCNVTGFTANLFFADGSSVTTTSNASIDRGTAFCWGPNFMDPEDP